MRLASFNLENLFERAAALSLPWDEGKPILDDYSSLASLISKKAYSQNDKTKMHDIMADYKGLLTKKESEYIILREIRGKLLNSKGEIVANGRDDWIGWFDLAKKPVNEVATDNTARVIRETAADVLCVVEAESRPALVDFNEAVVSKVWGQKFGHVMLIDGNDTRGIDVGIMLQDDFPILSIVSHVDDSDETGTIFSRDCAEYLIKTPSGNKLLVLVNHLKSKGYGSYASSAAKRKRQAKRARAIYDARAQEGYDYIAITGDFNDTPDSDALVPLLMDGSNLADVMSHPNFAGDGRPGTYGNGAKSEKIDYILMSPGLADKVNAGGIMRKGVWGGKNGTLFPHFPEIQKEIEAASDHAALWVDVSI
jgi:endonuclease/exonuclease/phosphatase family metal-dependent hydrolase